jgi:hypothetical protein
MISLPEHLISLAPISMAELHTRWPRAPGVDSASLDVIPESPNALHAIAAMQNAYITTLLENAQYRGHTSFNCVKKPDGWKKS